jgi:hypothetical protein
MHLLSPGGPHSFEFATHVQAAMKPFMMNPFDTSATGHAPSRGIAFSCAVAMRIFNFLIIVSACLLPGHGQENRNQFFDLNRGKTLLNAHNCYPYSGKWADRIDRALGTGTPLAIEQDISIYVDPVTHEWIPKVAHEHPFVHAQEPTLEHYFFDRVKPIVENALQNGKTNTWPFIILILDINNEDPRALAALRKLLLSHQAWLTSAVKTADETRFSPLSLAPILVLAQGDDREKKAFYGDSAIGDRFYAFGAARTSDVWLKGISGKRKRERAWATAPPEKLLPTQATNYTRWWEPAWEVVEEGGQVRAGAWTEADAQRLKLLVDYAHAQGYWVRFWTEDGFDPRRNQGWEPAYNFGSLDAAKQRWRSMVLDGTDMVATDQYEEFVEYRNQLCRNMR